MPPENFWPQLIVTPVLTAVLAILFVPIAKKLDLVDYPAGRKVHTEATPLVGGIAIFTGAFLVIALTMPLNQYLYAFILASSLAMLTGLVDDRREMTAHSRFAVQIIACLVLILFSDVLLSDFGRLMWDGVLGLGWLAVPITVFSAVGVINAFNMIDGLDGLSGSIFIIAVASMAGLALRSGHTDSALLLMIAIAAVCGFLILNARFPWNPKARIFLGDSGSVLLGFFLAWQFIDLGNGADRSFAPITAAWLFAVPLVDTTFLMFKRWREGKAVYKADQQHLHHAFLKSGFSVTQTWLTITGLAVLTAGIGLLGELAKWPEYLRFYGFLAFALAYFRVMNNCWLNERFLGRDFIVTSYRPTPPPSRISPSTPTKSTIPWSKPT